MSSNNTLLRLCAIGLFEVVTLTLGAACRYNWAENMRAWRVDMQLPYPGAAGALVHSGERHPFLVCGSPSSCSAAQHRFEAQN